MFLMSEGPLYAYEPRTTLRAGWELFGADLEPILCIYINDVRANPAGGSGDKGSAAQVWEPFLVEAFVGGGRPQIPSLTVHVPASYPTLSYP